MSNLIHVFRCGEDDLYGLTEDQSGGNLPAGKGQGAWRHMKTIDFETDVPPEGPGREWLARKAAIEAGIALNGYFLTEADALPSGVIAPG